MTRLPWREIGGIFLAVLQFLILCCGAAIALLLAVMIQFWWEHHRSP